MNFKIYPKSSYDYYKITSNDAIRKLRQEYHVQRSKVFIPNLMFRIPHFEFKEIDHKLTNILSDILPKTYYFKGKILVYAMFLNNTDLLNFRKKSSTKEKLTQYIIEQISVHTLKEIFSKVDSFIYMPNLNIVIFFKS